MSDTLELDDDSHAEALPVGFQLNNFRLVKVLGRGGFGITYQAEEIRHGKVVAIKEFFPIQLARRDGVSVRALSGGTKKDFDQYLKKFFDEATTLLRFGHLNHIVSVRSYFPANGTGYLMMDFETGQPLDRHLATLGRALTEAEVLAILIPLLEDLEQVHATNILHRDIKPQNIIIRPDGSPVLVDFGAARYWSDEASDPTRTAFHSEGYTPWEQYSRDGRQGPWTDLYALGATAYQMVTGYRLQGGLDRKISTDRHVSVAQETAPGAYSSEFLKAIDWALQLDMAQRPQSAAAWRRLFESPVPKPPVVLEPPVSPSTWQMGKDAYDQNDYATAIKVWRPLADEGDAIAQYWLGVMYDDGEGVDQDDAEALKWYLKSAGQGYAAAQYWLGVMYDDGEGVDQDDDEALKWYRKAARQGDAAAQYSLGIMYQEGQGVEQDDAEALKWYRRAARQGYAHAQYRLGVMYQEGQGVEQDDDEALKWYRKAAEQGDPDAQHALGVMYHEGQGVERDDAEAVKWHRKAAEQGDAAAQYRLGLQYKNGWGVTKDYVQAYIWFMVAADQGHGRAPRSRDAVAKQLTRAQIAEAKKQAATLPKADGPS